VILGGLFSIVWSMFRGPSSAPVYGRTMQAVLIGLMAESLLCLVLNGPIGFLFWSSIGFCIAFRTVAEEQQSTAMARVPAVA
jgi:hypothetical protein